MRRAALLLLLICAVTAGLLAPASGAQASLAQPGAAKISADFLAFNPAAAEFLFKTVDGRGLGVRPSPVDFSYVTGSAAGALVGVPPATYNLNALGRVTSVKNQNPYGTCWSFATYGSLESCLLPGESLDFSEDNLVRQSGFTLGTDLYNVGGNLMMSTAYLARWGGPVWESEDAYGDNYTPSGLTARKHVQEVIWLPARGSATDNTAVKNAVMTYGGVYAAMYWTGSSGGSQYYDASNAAYYYGPSATSNHAVLIVGWDDNYARTNFATDAPANGAFLVKNSWGTSFGNNGYFWVSYYDGVFGRDDIMAVYNSAAATTNFSGIYQYDPLGHVLSLGFGGETAWFANIFTAQSTSTLTAVGFYALAPNTTYEVYTGGSTLATKTLRTSGTLAEMGFHTVPLPSPVAITAGQGFSVAVKVTSPGATYPVAAEYPLSGYSSGATALTGQSFVSSSGSTWSDITSQYRNTNVCLKAYTGGSGGTTKYTLTTSVAAGAGSITRNPDLTSYDSGAVVTLTAVPEPGYAFVSWGGGVTGSTNPATVTMNANKSVTATFARVNYGGTRYEQTHSYFTYSGTWTTTTSSYYSGSSYKYSNTVNATVTAKFTGSAVSYIARTGTNQGIADITLDGVSYTADLYSSSTKYKQTVWSMNGLGDGVHVLQIKRSGTKNSASSGYYVNIDALDIVGQLVNPVATTYTLTTSVPGGNGTITVNPVKSAYDPGDVVTLTAIPAGGYTFVSWGGSEGGTTNPLTVTMNANESITAAFAEDSGGEPTTYTLTTSVPGGNGTITVNPVKSAYDPGDVVTLTAVPAGDYTFVSWGGSESGSANPLTVTMSANESITATFAAAGGTATRYEDTNSYLVYLKTWSRATSSLYSGGSYRYTNYAGAKVTITFSGTAISYVARTGNTYGKASVTLDGGAPVIVDLYSAATTYKKVVWSATGLSPTGTHTLVIERTGTRNSLSRGYTVNLDALDIVGTLLPAS